MLFCSFLCGPVLAHVPSFGRNPSGSPDFLAYPVPKACMHVLGTGVPGRLVVACSPSSPKSAQALGCSLTPGLRNSIGRVTCMARAASVPGLWTLRFLLLCGACVCVWVLLGLGLRLCFATAGWGFGVCVCLCARSACTPPLRAKVCGLGVCAWARVLAAPRHSWPGCWGLCLLACALGLYPATPGWAVRRGCVCFGSSFGCSPPLLAGVLGFCFFFLYALRWYSANLGWGARCGCVCLASGCGCAPPLLAGVFGCLYVCVRAPLMPRHCWQGCTVWVGVLGPWLWLRPATPGWRVGLCVCVFVCTLRWYPATPAWGARCGWVCFSPGFSCAPPLLAGILECACARSACTPPLLAGPCAVGVCAWATVLAAPRHSLLGCWGVCVLVCVLRLYPATPGWGLRRWCVFSGSGFGCAPPLLAGVLGGVCVFVCALRLYHATPGSGVGVCVCLCARSARTPPLLAGVCGVGVFVFGSGLACAPPLKARVLVFACLCARSACIPPLLAGVCVVDVCAWARVSAGPATPGWDVGVCVCVCLRTPLVPRHS